ncbi:hydroxypyruvate isomerase [Rhodococcus sp. RS1C4]|uniref:hydroxypyruvate isomerase family protein n=1 Tax=Rhodococcus sp. 14-2470-1a TaxID=2023150 RepID=UPI000B9A252A|nr:MULTISPECIES: TIM barrel protein [unclassified Rhodococcus (in: high G+C Gram-positive bacteria)]OZC45948.1 hydroxypyruvate isomerase [Rhodococcus sp. 06-621-2]OZC48547.1 hydroxypyruvate isomerase [Rhodococcus sp. RS1C4]OZD72997.1 hydroxypyruvate isomerase [Rhodococcus sp. 06-1059B-a]OZE79267.1 hydroxypyruvate isomerase [Rhodococcus sp. 15-649-1-2]OZF01080.1 hydroxypyruvate isomerase [Rhodococcus sp. 15-1154-1]
MQNNSYTVNCSILFTDIPLLERPAAAKAAGFDAVEFWWPFPTPVPGDSDVDAFVSAVRDAGVQLTGLNFAAGDMPAGDRGILSDPSQVRAFRDNIDVTVGIGKTLGTGAFNALYGNRIEGSDPAEQDRVAAENLAAAGAAAADIGAVVLIEPVSGAPAYPLLTADDAVAVIRRVERDHDVHSLRLLADLYHLDVNGDDVAAALDSYSDLIGHVQIADSPGRGEPGTGTLDLPTYLSQLSGNGYDGYIGVEYKATRPDTFSWLRDTSSWVAAPTST